MPNRLLLLSPAELPCAVKLEREVNRVPCTGTWSEVYGGGEDVERSSSGRQSSEREGDDMSEMREMSEMSEMMRLKRVDARLEERWSTVSDRVENFLFGGDLNRRTSTPEWLLTHTRLHLLVTNFYLASLKHYSLNLTQFDFEGRQSIPSYVNGLMRSMGLAMPPRVTIEQAAWLRLIDTQDQPYDGLILSSVKRAWDPEIVKQRLAANGGDVSEVKNICDLSEVSDFGDVSDKEHVSDDPDRGLGDVSGVSDDALLVDVSAVTEVELLWRQVHQSSE
eukprot:GHVN01012547.1.p1 GENE.GHVN01012547.1~~GHVN01012547.1.p1  ORF type:complete len:296 (+),score=122.18 GHVN01012547.1:55-888(+)